MKYQRIKTSPLERMERPESAHDGIPVRWEGETLPDLPEGQAWALIEDMPPFNADTQKLVRVLTAERDGWDVVDLTEEEIAERNANSTGVTKLQIMKRLGDKWLTFKGILAQLPEEVKDVWDLATKIYSDDPLLQTYREQLKTGLSLTDEEFDALLIPEEV